MQNTSRPTSSARFGGSWQCESPVATGSGFDYYLLNLSWSPEFCYSHPNAPECASHPAFVLHGLWPQNTTAPIPKIVQTRPGPPIPRPSKTSIPTRVCLSTNGKRTAHARAWVPTTSSPPPGQRTNPSSSHRNSRTLVADIDAARQIISLFTGPTPGIRRTAWR